MIKVSQGILGPEELAAVREAFDYGYFGHAHTVIAFENALKVYLGAPDVVAVNSGTSALHLALDALGIGHGDEVIVPSLTFVSAFQAIAMTGALPVACDVDGDTLLMDVDDAESRITPRTKALMPVHYGGQSCDVDRLKAINQRYGLHIVEDAAHAFGSFYRGERVGSRSDVACFSFDSIKNITCGEGGAIACRDAGLADRLRQKRMLGVDRGSGGAAVSKGCNWQFSVVTQGFRYHMSNINAAIGLAQLSKIDRFVAYRRAICRRYDESFRTIEGLRLLRTDYDQVAPHIFVVRVTDGRRDALMHHLADQEIEAGINYIPNHFHPYFRASGAALPETEQAFSEILTLPLHCRLTDEDVTEVITSVHAFFGAGGGAAR
jgi:dTDP-4-amino-4,6-dideoxygalactose transaminase